MNLSSYCSPKTKIRKSSIDKNGRFAKNTISKGEIIAIRSGQIINGKELKENKNVISDSEHQISDDFYLASLTKKDFDNVMCFINHSCDPNVGILGNVIVVAIRDIKVGEELCLDYAMVFSHNKKIECRCGSKICRKVITGKDWMRKELQEKYGEYFSSYLLQKIRNQ